jgi:hypothetical protein
MHEIRDLVTRGVTALPLKEISSRDLSERKARGEV